MHEADTSLIKMYAAISLVFRLSITWYIPEAWRSKWWWWWQNYLSMIQLKWITCKMYLLFYCSTSMAHILFVCFKCHDHIRRLNSFISFASTWPCLSFIIFDIFEWHVPCSQNIYINIIFAWLFTCKIFLAFAKSHFVSLKCKNSK